MDDHSNIYNFFKKILCTTHLISKVLIVVILNFLKSI